MKLPYLCALLSAALLVFTACKKQASQAAPADQVESVRALSARISELESKLTDRLVESRRSASAMDSKISDIEHKIELLASDVGRMASTVRSMNEMLEKHVKSNATPPRPLSKVDPDNLPYGVPVVGKPGFCYSPYAEDQGFVDATGLKRGTRIKCPYTNVNFRVP